MTGTRADWATAELTEPKCQPSKPRSQPIMRFRSGGDEFGGNVRGVSREWRNQSRCPSTPLPN
jgi:hypothetical protein